LIIFAEGTVSNGKYILTFKKGAFKALRPVKLYAIKQESKSFIPWMCDMGEKEWLISCLSNSGAEITLYEFEDVYDPSYLNLDPDDEDSWKVYAGKVRDILSKCLNSPKVN